MNLTPKQLEYLKLKAYFAFYDQYETADFTCAEEMDEAWQEIFKETVTYYLARKHLEHCNGCNKKDKGEEKKKEEAPKEEEDHSSW